MKQTHKSSEKCFVDYAGPTVPIINVLTGELTRAQIFVAVLGATSAQKTADWLLGQRKAFEYFGGVTQVVVPNNPRSLVANPDRYEPQDKGQVEVGVQVVERWILASLRH